MVDLQIRHVQLARLIETLNDVLAILRLDRQCVWTVQFEQFLQTAQELAAAGFTQSDLNDFSGSICRVCNPNEGLSRDYRPPAGLPAQGSHGTDNFKTFARTAYGRALELRAIDRKSQMGEVEASLLEYLRRRLNEGRQSVSADELREGVLREHPEFRHRAAFRHGLQRLSIRHVINAVDAPDGTCHYFIGPYPTPEIRASLGLP